MESCSQQSIAECTHEGQAAVLGLPSPIFVPLPWLQTQEMRCWFLSAALNAKMDAACQGFDLLGYRTCLTSGSNT